MVVAYRHPYLIDFGKFFIIIFIARDLKMLLPEKCVKSSESLQVLREGKKGNFERLVFLYTRGV